MRLFVAIRFSPQVNAALLRAQNILRRQGSGNFTQPENLHLTLAFIGETNQLDAAIRAINTIKASSFTVKVSEMGHFGDLYWAGTGNNAALSALQKRVSRALEAEGFSLEKRTFRPHLTLCRRFRPYVDCDLRAAQAALNGAECRITRVSLMESRRIQGKLIYTERYGVNLA
ncbi:MAG: RNA 2',3'-cyclic phosphodiesterase [Clostridiales bacterium]|nr:RNA 2',3'-cyclic phosphodiesterase [Candidatus Cacconaster stercorequi]